MKNFEVIELFRQYLHERGIFFKFINNVKKYHSASFAEYLRNYVSLYRQYHRILPNVFVRQRYLYSDMVELGFEFSDTPEGSDFWSARSREWRMYLDESLRSAKYPTLSKEEKEYYAYKDSRD